MSRQYERPEARDGGLRLHLNENTAGCSPKVQRVLSDLTREQAAFYPDYDAAIAASAAHFGVTRDHVVLTNGLDDGIMLASLVALRGATAADPFEAIVVQPAFDMYAACADAMGGKIVEVPPQTDLFFPLQRVVDAIGPRTRIIFLTNPNNPTGLSIPKATVAAIAQAAPAAIVFLDEAYADFAGQSMIDDAASGTIPNLLVGRTFAKAFGLAGLRIGALIGRIETLAPIRRAVLPYTLNAYATAALPAALDDREYYEWYLAEVRESKRLLYDVLARAGVRFWPSDGNFVLVSFGDDLDRVIAAVARRGINIRDRSADPGCGGCARITAGVLDHTRQLVAALEEVLCGGQ
jgi:histidinol-phosphate aminotransferase